MLIDYDVESFMHILLDCAIRFDTTRYLLAISLSPDHMVSHEMDIMSLRRQDLVHARLPERHSIHARSPVQSLRPWPCGIELCCDSFGGQVLQQAEN